MLSPASSFEKFLESISKLRTSSLESLGSSFDINCSDAESSSWLRPCKDREVTRVLVSDVSDAVNAQSPPLVSEQVVHTRNSPDVKVEQDEDEINERFDLALFLRKQKSSTRGERRARKFRPPDPPGSTLSTDKSLSLLRKKLNIPDEIELVVPDPHERADDPPEGDNVIDVDRERKRARARSASLPRCVSSSVFESKASTRSLFSTLVFDDDDLAPINTKSSGDMMRQGLNVGHELEAKIEDLNEKLEDETRRTETARSAAAGFLAEHTAVWASLDKKNAELDEKSREIVQLRAAAKKSAKALLTAAEEREQCSAAILTKRDGELVVVTEKLRQANEHIQSLQRKFTRARNKFDELQGDLRGNMVYQVQRVANLDLARLLLGLIDGQEPPRLEDELTFLTADVAEHAGDEECFERLMKNLHGLLHVLDPQAKALIAASVGVADPSGSLLGGTSSCKATIVGVDGKFSLIGGVGAEVTKSRIDDVTEGAGTVGAPEEMRTDEDFQGPRIDALTEDSRLDDVFGEMEAEGAPVTQVAPPGVDEETVP
ncbi:hypothetical protein AALP_AAs54424U000200 [Arabis alpina]|uniref:Uncharacterized protein n=1 Tax=Arabis alpina TaxID=50452 RepID=A0A087FZF8_ARAAL|nr:hypothetical protein AALP_AAs54424U000200 [Arabis alpina]